MWVVSNRIQVQKGMGVSMAPRFTQSKALCNFDGFVKVEVLVAECTEYDEMSVNMYWHSMEQYQVWRDSDAFKAAHKRPVNQEGDAANSHNPVISSQMVIAYVAAQLENS